MKKIRRTIGALLSIITIISNLVISEPLEVQAVGTFKITATQDSRGSGSVIVDWSGYDYADKNFKVYRSNDGGKTYETVGIDYKSVERVRVLQIYPAVAQLNNWVVNTGYGQGIIEADEVFISDFNKNPSNYLYQTSNGWNYDVIYFGTWDRNNFYDLSVASRNVVEKFIKSGKGCIFGHDTILCYAGRSWHPSDCREYADGGNKHGQGNFDYIAYNYFPVISTYDPGYEEYTTGGTVKITRTGLFTTYPNYIGEEGTLLSIPTTHSWGQRVNSQYQDNVWLKFTSKSESDPTNFFLITYNNLAMIQTGHSYGAATSDEQKILANIIFYCNQLLFNTYKTTDRAAQDRANPNTPTISFGASNVEFSATDNGSNYFYYVESYDKNDTTSSGMLDKSNTAQVNVTTNVRSFRYIFDNSSSTVVTKTTGTSVAASSNYTGTAPYKSGYTYVHVAAVDGAGNLGPTATKKIGYSVSYNGNGATSGSVNSQSCEYGITYKVASNGYSKKGYTFKNWNTKANGTGVTYTAGQSFKDLGSITLYAQWQPIKYNIYYDKGKTTDTSTTTIKGATRNTNIQSTGTNRPYINTTYDSNLTFATPGSLKGRKYTLTFNTNIPASITKQQNNRTAVPTTVNTVTGNLPSQNKWQITGQDGTVTTNLTPTMGSTVNSPNYVSVNNASVTATALWNNKILNGYGTPTLTGWKFVGWYDNQSGAKSTAVSNTTDMIRVVNTTTDMSANTNVKVTGNVTSYTVQPKTTDFNQTLYARWQRTITLTFNMNGGKYYYTDDSGNKQATNGVVLTGIYYNNADGYEFSLDDTLTSASLPNYEKQINKIDAYGTYNDNGENSKYGKYLSDETRYRFLGWSTNPNATVPDSGLITYDSNHKTKYRIYDDTVLYAVWEPVLTVYVSLNNTNGNKNFSDGSSPVLSGQAVAADGTQYLSIIAYPGETVEYNVVSLGRADRELYVGFDNKITDIYENYGSWTDSYNPSTSEDTYSGQHQGLNRHISPASKYIKRSFVVPMYLGTEFSYSTSIGVGKYYIVHEMMQNSYYFKYCKGEDEEKVRFVTVLYITNNKNYNGPDDPGPDVPIIPANPDNPIHSPAEIKTTIEFESDN